MAGSAVPVRCDLWDLSIQLDSDSLDIDWHICTGVVFPDMGDHGCRRGLGLVHNADSCYPGGIARFCDYL